MKQAGDILLLIHAFATWMMAGIIFFVQVVYLPVYRRFQKSFSGYEKNDLVHMGYLVGPIFFLEIITGVSVAFIIKQSLTYRILSAINIFLLLLIWIVSVTLRYRAQRSAKNILLITRMYTILLTSNWFRTICWVLRGVVVFLMLLFHT